MSFPKKLSSLLLSANLLLLPAHATDQLQQIANASKRVYEACKLRKIQTGVFPSTISDVTSLLSPELRAVFPGQIEIDDPDSPAMFLRRSSPVAERVPWLRIRLEDAPYPSNSWLNVSCDGTVFRSKLYWQSEFVHLHPLKFQLEFGGVLGTNAVTSSIARRSKECEPAQLDLSAHATANPLIPWMTRHQFIKSQGTKFFYPDGDYAPALSSLCRTGILTVSNHLFDVRALVHLDGATGFDYGWVKGFPTATSNIVVNAAASKLHVLAGVYQRSPPNTKVASVRLNYSDGDSFEIPIRYGVEVADARAPSTSRSVQIFPNEPVSSLPETEGIAIPALFYFVLDNPQPKKPVSSLKLVSTEAVSHPYFLAITLE